MATNRLETAGLLGKSGCRAIVLITAIGAGACSGGAGGLTGSGGAARSGGSGSAASGGIGGPAELGSGSGGSSAEGTGGLIGMGSGGIGTGGRGSEITGSGGDQGPSGTGGAVTGGAGGAGAGNAATGGSSGGAGGSAGGGGSPIVDLFNGTDLTGFNAYEATTTANNAPGVLLGAADAQIIFKPESGMIHVYGDLPDQTMQYHYLLQTVASYGKYNLWWEYKWGTKKFSIDATGRGLDLTQYPRDAGVMWHIHGDRTQVWPASIEFQNKWGSTGDIFAAYSVCTSLGLPSMPMQFADTSAGGKPVTVNGATGLVQHMRSADWETPGVGPEAATGAGSDWNACLLQVDGGTAVYTVNGHVVNEVLTVTDKTGAPVISGFIGWQAEQAEVYYRSLRIQVLP